MNPQQEQQEQQELFDLIEAGDLVGLKTRLHDIESSGQSLSEVLTTSQKGMTMFHVACEQGQVEIVELLLEKGSKIDERCETYSDRLLLEPR